MINLQRIAISHFVEELQDAYHRTYSNLDPEYGNIIAWTSRLALENIINSDALYHNFEHTVMVTLAGQAILEGKHLVEGGISPRDWMHFMIALLCHDIGYVRGVCRADRGNHFATGIDYKLIELAPGGTDVALTPYHVDRSKLFVKERFGSGLLENMETVIDTEEIATYIEMTRFPPPDDEWYQNTTSFAGLVRAADFIGQLGDPNYLRKTPALFYEFEETNSNEPFGYKNPGDLRKSYGKFFWNVVYQYIRDSLQYLEVTLNGKQWIANLYANVYAAEYREFPVPGDHIQE